MLGQLRCPLYEPAHTTALRLREAMGHLAGNLARAERRIS